MADENEKVESPEPPAVKIKTPKLLLLLLVLNLGASGAVAAKVMTAPPPAPAAETAAAAEDKAAVEVPGPVHTMDPYIVNLNEASGGRFLKATVEVQLSDDAALAELTQDSREVRDNLLRYFSDLTVVDTMGEQAKLKIQGDIVARLNEVLQGEKVKRVYFAEFVVQ